MTSSVIRSLIILALFVLPVVVIAAHWVHSAMSSVDGMNPALAASYCCMEENIAAA